MAKESNGAPKEMRPKHIPKKFYAKGEKLLFESHTHWASWKLSKPIVSIATALISMMFSTWPPALGFNVPHVSAQIDSVVAYVTDGQRYTIFYVAANVLWWWYLGIRWYSAYCNVYGATDQRVLRYRPWIGKSLSDIPLSEIDDVYMPQTLRQRILGYGPVEFFMDGKMVMKWDAFPEHHQKDLLRALKGRLPKTETSRQT